MNIEFLTPSEKQSSRLQVFLERYRSSIKEIDDSRHIFVADGDYLRLRIADKPQLFTVDFLSGTMAYRRKFGGGRNQMIAKAVGIKSGHRPAVIDATAGFGRDAFVLASLGCRVHMIERSPVMGILLKDGLERARRDPEIGPWISNRLSLELADTCQEFGFLPFQPDVVYLDPMYPEKKKAALVKKEMRILKSVVGEDPDAGRLLDAAFTMGAKRVVVKRPARAGWLNDREPNMSFKTAKNRFDLYLIS